MSDDTERRLKDTDDRLRQAEKDIVAIETNQSQFTILFSKFDDTIERFSDVNQSIKELLIVHEKRIEQVEKTIDKLTEILEFRKTSDKTELENTKNTVKEELQNLKHEFETRDDILKSMNIKQNEKIDKLMKVYYALFGGATILVSAIGFWEKIASIVG